MLIIKVDYKNVNEKIRDEFVKYMKRWLHISINEYWVDYEVFPTFLTVMVRYAKDVKIIEDVVDSFVKRNDIDVINYINACPSKNSGICKTIVFEETKTNPKVVASFNRYTGDSHYTEDFIDEIVDRVVARLDIKQGATYADAVEAISNDPDLWTSDKTMILSWLVAGLDSDVYQAIINVTKSSMVSTAKRDTIVDIAKKASSIMDNE